MISTPLDLPMKIGYNTVSYLQSTSFQVSFSDGLFLDVHHPVEVRVHFLLGVISV